MMDGSLFTAASGLAELGYRVFPLSAKSKRPRPGSSGLLDATCDVDLIELAWTHFPDSNIGVSTEGLFVLDVDSPKGQPNPWLTTERHQRLSAGGTAIARTPRGGTHYYFRQPVGADLRNTADKIAPKIDTRANGGYIVAAPSVVVDPEKGINGGYQWVQPLNRAPEDLPEPPAWLLEMLNPAPIANAAPLDWHSQDAVIERARKYLATMPGAVAGQGGHNATFRAACVLTHGFELGRDDALALLADWNLTCEPPWGQRDLEHKIDSAFRLPGQRGYLRTTDPRNFDRVEIPRYSSEQPQQRNGKPRPPKSSMTLQRASDVQRQEISWLWPDRIARGKLNLLCGDPGLGKSHLVCDLAARVSRGAIWPDGSEACEAGSVVLFAAEDDVADTIRPRLDRANADADKVYVYESMRYTDPETGEEKRVAFSIGDHLEQLEEAIDKIGDVRLLVIDPISSYTGKTDSHKNAEVRSMLQPLADLAARKGIALLAITHLSKGTGGKGIYRATGSLAFAAAARIVWLLAKDLDDPHNRLLVPIKANIAKQMDGMRFSIEGDIGGSFVRWDNRPVQMTADEFLAKEARQQLANPEKDGAASQAIAFLKEQLFDGPMLSRDIDEAAKENGISAATLRRAKEALGVKARKRPGDQKWEAYLPDQDAHFSLDRNVEHLAHLA